MNVIQTERSHEENQERAYIAASRRADRSIEARVQSARMASDIHKKRTGKGFRITEEIVLKEEMYEEEEDEFPRSYRILANNLHGNGNVSARAEAYLSNKMAMSQLLARTNEEWRENEINRLFAQSFPNANQQMHQMPHGMPPQQDQTMQNDPNFYSPRQQSQIQSPGMPEAGYMCQNAANYQKRRRQSDFAAAKCRRRSGAMSPSTLSNHSSPDTVTTRTDSVDSAMTAPETPVDGTFSRHSVFTTELPPEARMLMGGFGADDVMGQTIASQEWMDPMQMYQMSYDPSMQPPSDQPMPNYFATSGESMPSKWAMPTTTDEDNWAAFMNDSAFTVDT